RLRRRGAGRGPLAPAGPDRPCRRHRRTGRPRRDGRPGSPPWHRSCSRRVRLRGRERALAQGLSDRRGCGARSSDRRTDYGGGLGMSLLLPMTGWHVEDWRDRFQALLPEMPIVVLGEAFDRRAVHYVASWKHPPGSLTGLPNLAAVFSLGAG